MNTAPVLAGETEPVEYQGASPQAIQHHYDLSNNFYQLFLDSHMVYSSALWEEGDTLESAQLRKIDFHVNQARANNAKRVLDIGCGWGETLKRLVENYDVSSAVGLTPSQAQANWIQTFDHPNVQVYLEGWANHVPNEAYDSIISIGAFEHFVKLGLSPEQKIKSYRHFFQYCHQWLKPGGWLSLQTIVLENAKPEDFSQFIVEEVFPESDLPYLAEIAEASGQLFEIVTLRNDRQHYVNTLRHWLNRLKTNRTAAIELMGEEMVDKYEKYFKLFIIAFHTGTVNLSRLALRRIDRPRQ